MTERRHDFENVDKSAEPKSWARCLSRLHGEPFYREYKAQVRNLLSPMETGCYLEVGTGIGTDALALGAPVTGVDKSVTMCREASTRGVKSVAACGETLPFSENSFDGCWADRTFQHISNPECALKEIIRVTKPGGIIVTVDPDYAKQVMELPDQSLARKVLNYRAYHAIRNGSLGHRMPALFLANGVTHVEVEPMALVVRDPSSLDNVLGLRTWAHTTCGAGYMTRDEVHLWETQYDKVVEDGLFLWSVTFFIVSGRKKAGGRTS